MLMPHVKRPKHVATITRVGQLKGWLPFGRMTQNNLSFGRNLHGHPNNMPST